MHMHVYHYIMLALAIMHKFLKSN